MKILDPLLSAALAAESSVIAWCWLIERKDGLALGFTSFDLMLAIDGVPYEPFTGFTPSADSNSEGLQGNNSQDLEGLLTSEQVSYFDLLAGLYDEGRITCFLVDVTNLPLSLETEPPQHLTLYRRYIARTIQSDLGFRFELRDDDWQLQEAKLGKQTSKFCGYDLGDARCRVDLSAYTFTQTITNVTNRYQFESSGSFTPGQFDRGKITFTTGANTGVSRDISTFSTGNQITLWQPVPSSIAIGDEVVLIQGCGKTLYDCVVRYNNAVNSDSEPHIPTVDQAINTPISS